MGVKKLVLSKGFKKSPATFGVLSSWKEDHGAYCYFLVPSSQLCSATLLEAQQLLQSPSSGSLSSGNTCNIQIYKVPLQWV